MDMAPWAREKWDALRLWDLESGSDEPTTRAYSLANTPEEIGTLILYVRLALPPAGAPEEVLPGIVSSWLFARQVGDPIDVSGPYGHFLPSDSDRELIYIGGGVGMAPIRSHIFYLLKHHGSRRTISFWYGARSRTELFNDDEFDGLARTYPNLSSMALLERIRTSPGRPSCRSRSSGTIGKGPRGSCTRCFTSTTWGSILHPNPASIICADRR
jgi:Na+-transporting NADH:ubiquinone oxidoreductase subunit F